MKNGKFGMWAKKEYIDALPEDSVSEVRKQKRTAIAQPIFRQKRSLLDAAALLPGVSVKYNKKTRTNWLQTSVPCADFAVWPSFHHKSFLKVTSIVISTEKVILRTYEKLTCTNFS